MPGWKLVDKDSASMNPRHHTGSSAVVVCTEQISFRLVRRKEEMPSTSRTDQVTPEGRKMLRDAASCKRADAPAQPHRYMPLSGTLTRTRHTVTTGLGSCVRLRANSQRGTAFVAGRCMMVVLRTKDVLMDHLRDERRLDDHPY